MKLIARCTFVVKQHAGALYYRVVLFIKYIIDILIILVSTRINPVS